MLNMGAIGAGVIGSQISEQVSGKVSDIQGKQDALHQEHECPACGQPFALFTDIHKMVHILAQMRDAAVPGETDVHVDERITLQPGTLVDLHTYGRKYTMIFVAASTAVIFQVMGVGTSVSITLVPGWNAINLPDGTQFGLPLAAPGNVPVLLRAADVMYGTAI